MNRTPRPILNHKSLLSRSRSLSHKLFLNHRRPLSHSSLLNRRRALNHRRLLNRSKLQSHRPLRLKGIPSQLYFTLVADPGRVTEVDLKC
jgi:hypothetical protein